MRLDRYILAEILGPLTLGFFVYTIMLLIQALFKSAKLIISSGVEASTVGQLLLLSLPHIVVMTIPMSFLFGILIAVGRLSSDSELIAIRASGVSLFSLYRPILLMSLLLTGLNAYLMITVLPGGNQALQQLRLEILTQSITQEIEPRVPHTGWQDKMLYIFEAPPGEQRWRGFFMADAVPTRQSEIVVAEWGEARNAGDEILLSLTNAVTHRVDLYQPDSYELALNSELDLRVATTGTRAITSVKRSLRELSFRELWHRATDPGVAEPVRRLASVELHKKLSIPTACLVFGLLGLPLGFSNRRGGRSSGFAISIGVILVYYVMLSSGEEIARDGQLPAWIAVWYPNLVLLVVGLFLLARRNQDKSLVLTKLDRWIQEHLWGRLLVLRSRRQARRQRREALLQRREESGDRSSPTGFAFRLPDWRLRFPNSIDRYVLMTFLQVLMVSLLAGVTVYLVADLTDKFDEILDYEVATSVVLDYYKFKSFSIIYEITPLIVLMTTLITFGLLSRTNEIIACKALGMSLYRLAVPVVLLAMVIAATAGFLQSEVLAASNARAAQLEATIKGQEESHRRSVTSSRRWIYGKGNRLYNFSFYDEGAHELQRLQVFQFDEAYRLTGRLMADRARYLEEGWWMLSSGWRRTWKGAEEVEFERFDEPVRYLLQETQDYFQGGLQRPEEMNYVELRDYVRELEEAGQSVPLLEVALHNKIAYPVISLVMALVALPFAFRLGRQGALYGIGLSLVMGVVLLIVLGIFTALGENAILPPLIAVWSPAALFSIFALYLFLGVRT